MSTLRIGGFAAAHDRPVLTTGVAPFDERTRPGTRKRVCNVYVIELDRAVMAIGKFRKANPDARPDRMCVYVGATSLPPEERFRQHKEGKKANRYARKFGVRLVQRLMKNRQGLESWKKAEESERRCAEKLRRRGYAVWWG